MSIAVSPVAVSPPKRFVFDTRDRRSVARGIGGMRTADTTSASTTSTSRVTLKQYTITPTGLSNKMRIVVYGHQYSGGTLYVYLNINGTDVVSTSTGSATPVVVIDYLMDVTPNTRYTIKIDGYASPSGNTVYIDAVYIIVGLGLTSTTETTILTATLDPTYDTYAVDVAGNFTYKVGVRCWVVGNRKTTASAVIRTNLPNVVNGYSSLSAGNDYGNTVVLFVATGDYASSFSVSGYVGASGDIIIVVEVYAQVTLRGIIADSGGASSYWMLVINEVGNARFFSVHGSIDGSSLAVRLNIAKRASVINLYASSTGSTVTVSNQTAYVTKDCVYHVDNGGDNDGRGVLLYVEIIIT
jgi:hypothetical protein